MFEHLISSAPYHGEHFCVNEYSEFHQILQRFSTNSIENYGKSAFIFNRLFEVIRQVHLTYTKVLRCLTAVALSRNKLRQYWKLRQLSINMRLTENIELNCIS